MQSPLPNTGMRDRVGDLADEVPVGHARVGLLRRPAVHGDGRGAGVFDRRASPGALLASRSTRRASSR